MDAKDAVSSGLVRPLSGRIFLRLTTPEVSDLLHLPGYFGGSDAIVISAPENSVMRVGDTVLVDRYQIVFLVNEPHDADAIVYCYENAILCWTVRDILLPFPGWCLCLFPDSGPIAGLLHPVEQPENVQILEVVSDGNQPETFAIGESTVGVYVPGTDTTPSRIELRNANTKRITRRILVPRIAGFDIIYRSKRWRLVNHEDILAEISL